MNYQRLATSGLDYRPYRFGKFKQMYRGPRPDLSKPYVALIGGTETYGKYVSSPFPSLLEEDVGITCVNFGCVNAGVEAFVQDADIQDACSEALLTVVAVMPAPNMSNRFYAVHPRRNDRFIRASSIMKTLFKGMDFTDIHYTRHLLSEVRAADAMRFEILIEEIKAAWVARMRTLSEKITGKKLLLWMADHAPADAFEQPEDDGFGLDPLYVDQAMLDAVSQHFDGVVEAITSPLAAAQGTEGMIFAEEDVAAAAAMPGVLAHSETAKALAPQVRMQLT